jgi:hypothetical protein
VPADAPTGSAPHVTLEALANLDEGLLVPAQEQRIRTHLAGCPHCSARLESVVGIRAALGAAPPARLPADVGARLDAALAGAGGASRITHREIGPTHRRPTRWRPSGGLLATGAAASIVLLLFTALAAGALRGGPGGATSNSAARDTTSAARQPGADVPARAVTASGRNYTAATLRAALPALLGQQDASAQSRKSSAAQTPPGLAGRASQLGPCVAELAGRGGVTPLAVDVAKYAGQPAVVVVLPEAGPAKVLDVWVVRPGCTRGDPQLIYFTRLPRPAGIRSP